MIATVTPHRPPAQASKGAPSTTKKKRKTSIIKPSEAPAPLPSPSPAVETPPTPTHDDDSDIEEELAGPALAAEDMGLNLDEDLELAIFGDTATVLQPSRKKRETRNLSNTHTRGSQPPSSHVRSNTSQEWEVLTRITELEKQNTQLRAELLVKTQEVKALRHEALEYSLTPEDGAAEANTRSGSREAKIIELAKKARRLTVALERERSQNTVLSNQLKHAQIQERASKKEFVPDAAAAKALSEARTMKDKLMQATRKLEDERMAAQSLRTELRSMHQVLRKEIGDDVPLSKIMESGAGWKGRAQQIITLKAKISGLTHNHPPVGTNNLSTTPQPTSYDDAHRETIRRIESDRKLATEAAMKELSESRGIIDELKRKQEAVLARNKLLEREVKDHKRDLATLMRKAGTDDQLIAALHAQMARLTKKMKLQPRARGAPPPPCNSNSNNINANKRLSKYDLDHNLPTHAALELENASLSSMRETLEKRFLAATARIGELSSDLAKERRRGAANGAAKHPHTRHGGGGGNGTPLPRDDAEDMYEKLSLLEDENAALRTTLQQTQETTQGEIAIFHRLLQQTRDGFRRDMTAIVEQTKRSASQQGTLAKAGDSMHEE
ncbi:Coiled-coil domain-containing protein 13 [Thoreauomyces humboldtii]|nr:Coiled-coil domain-containing protein 13 [Thoreauomyces humboldtii]